MSAIFDNSVEHEINCDFTVVSPQNYCIMLEQSSNIIYHIKTIHSHPSQHISQQSYFIDQIYHIL